MRIQVFGDRNWGMCPYCEWEKGHDDCLVCHGQGYDEDAYIFIRDVLDVVTFNDDSFHTLVHGNARGADKFGALAAAELGFDTIQGYPADWARYGKGAGPIRNEEMAVSGLDLSLGFHNDIATSKGSKDMLYRLNKNCVEVRLFAMPLRKRSK